MRKVPIPTFGWQLQRMIAHLDNEILRLILLQSYPTHCNFFPSNFVLSPLVLILLARQNGRMFSSCFCARLQPLAQALDVFIVRLVLLLVHFQQRPQDFDAMLFLRHSAQRVQTRVQQDGIGLFS
mgnify:CR=1 FL=1